MTDKSSQIPLCVDLDGTLIKSDSLLESTIIAVRKNPLLLLLMPFWILKGRLYFKKSIEKFGKCEALLLPYRREVLDFLKKEKDKGRKIVLATATVKSIADDVSNYLGIFDEVIATETVNLRSEEKRKKLVEKFGSKGFDYIGDSRADLAVWASAANALVLKKSDIVLKKARELSNVIHVFDADKPSLNHYFREIRVYQWIKNILIFLPLFMAHEIGSFSLLFQNFIAFAVFCFAASSVYVTNDLFDIEADRAHPRKRFRPVASGLISVPSAVNLSIFLFLLSIVTSFVFLPLRFTMVLLVYLILTTAYSFSLKRVYIIDIIILAGLYTIRIIAGGAAVGVSVSFWMLAFSMFLFLNLAIVKRYTELKQLADANKTKTKGRGYHIDDINLLSSLGTTGGYLSVLVFALYVNSEAVVGLYKRPELLWAIVPVLLFWITRIWFMAHRGKMHDDPIVFTGKDPVSYVAGLIVVILIIGAAV